MKRPVSCQRLVRRVPAVVLQSGPETGREFVSVQVCGRPVEREGLCKTHLRREATRRG